MYNRDKMLQRKDKWGIEMKCHKMGKWTEKTSGHDVTKGLKATMGQRDGMA
jgi:hypothetical protein